MVHHLAPDVRNLHGSFNRDRVPVLTLDSGDTLTAGTLCAGWHYGEASTWDSWPPMIPPAERQDPYNDLHICLVGPIAVRGAQPGMTLEVEIEELRLGAFGLTYTGRELTRWQSRLRIREDESRMLWRFDEGAGIAHNVLGSAISLHPFLGCLGVAPEEPGHHSNLTPRPGGGNLDCRQLVAGSKLYLPIEVPDALFSFGDGHAAQGDGEICGTAIECPMDAVRLTLRLRDDLPFRWPVAFTPAGWITFGFHADLEEAMLIAMNTMLDLMMRRLEIGRTEAAMLASLCVDLHLTQLVNPLPGVHAIWRER